MKNIYFSILCSIVLSLTGCQTPEELVMDESSAGAHGFNVKFSDGESYDTESHSEDNERAFGDGFG